jgi:hypothetical protein
MFKFLRWLNFHRSIEVRFIGYPKTGNTWARYMLGRYLQLVCHLPSPVLFDGVDWMGRCERACVGPRVHFTHDPLTWQSQVAADLNDGNTVAPYRSRGVALLVRYPLDVLVSAWCQHRYRSSRRFEGGLEAFLAHPILGLEKFFRFYELWAAAAGGMSRFHLLRYEDLHADPTTRFREMLRFLGVAPAEDALVRAVRDASFESMKALEMSGERPKYRSSGLDIFGGSDRDIPESLHVRRGEIGGYAHYLDPAAAARYEALVATRMPALYGYARPPQ